MAIILWGPYWDDKHVCCLCDNAAVVVVVNKGAARDPTLSHLLRTLAVTTAVLNVYVSASHVPGVKNAAADALSHNHLPLFFSLVPQTSLVPAIIPPELRSLVLDCELQWTSPSWKGLWSTSFTAALRLPPAQSTSRLNAATHTSV